MINDEDVKAPYAPATFWRSAQGFLLGFAFGGVAVAVWCNGHNVMRLNPRIYTPIFLSVAVIALLLTRTARRQIDRDIMLMSNSREEPQ